MSASAIRFVFFSGNGLLACLEFRVVKRKLFSAPVKYTVNGMSTSHLVIPSFKLFIDGDVNPNPGQDDSNNSQASQVVIELPKSGLRIGQWNNSRLTNSKCEQIKFLLTSWYHRIDVLFLTETLLKSEVSDSLFPTPVFVLHRKDRPGNKKGGSILAFLSEKLKAGR